MEITTLLTAVAALGLPCSNPELRDYSAQELPWPAAYIRSIEGHNIIALREGTRDDALLPKILVHELLHCGCTRSESGADIRNHAPSTRAKK